MQTQSDEIVLLTGMISITFLFLLAFLATILFLYQKRSLEYYNSLETAKSTYEKSLLQSQIEIQEQTFQDISREIHDNIGLSLTLAKLQLNTSIANNIEKELLLEPAVTLITKAIEDLSYLSKSFNSDAVKTHGLYNTLKLEIDKIKRVGLYKIEFAVTGNVRFLDANKELIIYRIAQESLNNAIKYAEASQIRVALAYDDNDLKLFIVDNGKGFDPNALCSKGVPTGIQNMQTRALALNGNFEIKSRLNHGTTISITVPTTEENDN